MPECLHAKSFQSCLTLCNPTDCSPPGSSGHGILQGRILEWVAMPSSRGSAQPRDQTLVSGISCIGRWCSLPLHHLRNPVKCLLHIIFSKLQKQLLNILYVSTSKHQLQSAQGLLSVLSYTIRKSRLLNRISNLLIHFFIKMIFLAIVPRNKVTKSL